ncbi:MAG TPA: endonuclease/exonuclease/phosphatase family protein [Thermoanaerobaculia bacterium]|nr:endonuclease/exonuclease/phosphatase family protein [Thermoanaerobaculia bacterium]
MRRSLSLLVLAFVLAGCGSSRPQTDSFRVLVYNIHAGKDAAGVDNLERVAEIINSADAHLVLLQEVDRNTTRSGNVDQLARLEELTTMHGAFGKSLDYQGGEYGIAILSRWPIAATDVIPLPTDPPQPRSGGSIEPRIAFFAVTNGIRVVNTHLDASRDETYRLQEIAHLLETAKADEPLLIGGDFNAEPGSAVQQRALASGLRDAWTACGEGADLTFPASAPVKRIDYLYLSGDADCTEARVLATTASDHRPLLVTVERPIPRMEDPRERGRRRGAGRM